MTVLLDTATFLWAIGEDSLLSDEARLVLGTSDTVFVSSISLWEIAQKAGLGKLRLDFPFAVLPKVMAAQGFAELDFRIADALRLAQLPPLHRDPFDRMLVCQAIEGGHTLLTPDPVLHRYPVRAVW